MDYHKPYLHRVTLLIVLMGLVATSAHAADIKPAKPAKPASAVQQAPKLTIAPEKTPEVAPALPTKLAKEKSVYDMDGNILAHLSLGALNFLNLGVSYAPNSKWEYGVQGGWIGLTIGEYSGTTWNADAIVRFHPWEGAFYAAMGLRYYYINVAVPPSVLGQADPVGGTKIRANVTRFEVVPHFGWRWLIGKFSIGFELGAEIPFLATGVVTVDSSLSQNPLTAPQITSLETNGTNSLRTYIYYIAPMINFLKIGWKF